MVQFYDDQLDVTFAALADATRRGVIGRLAREAATVSDLAEQFQMTLTGMKKHISVLERVHLVRTEKVGRVRTCMLGTRSLDAEAHWIDAYQRLFEQRFDALDGIVSELKEEELNDRAR